MVLPTERTQTGMRAHVCSFGLVNEFKESGVAAQYSELMRAIPLAPNKQSKSAHARVCSFGLLCSALLYGYYRQVYA